MKKLTAAKTTTAVVPATALAAVIEAPAAPVVAPVTTQPAVQAATFAVAKSDFVPAKGFATVLFAEVAKAPGTIEEISKRLLASGDFAKVAPQAAAKRPIKPVSFLLRKWTATGVLRAA